LGQSALQFIGCDQASEEFLAASAIALGNSEERRRRVAEMARGATAAQDEDVVCIQIADPGAVDQRSHGRGNFITCADNRRIGTTAGGNRMFLERE
jgi:hypothetical protein